MCRLCATSQNSQNPLASDPSGASICGGLRIWWNWQTRYFEVVVPQGVQVQVLLSAPLFLRKSRILMTCADFTQNPPELDTRKMQFPKKHQVPPFGSNDLLGFGRSAAYEALSVSGRFA